MTEKPTADRLQKVLARNGLGSRRQIEDMIREGRITLNGRTAALGDRADLERDAVKVDGKRIFPTHRERHYVLLYKPSGYMSTVKDPEGRPTVLDLLPQRLRQGMVPVGRLDYGTEGLLLLTNDGDFAQRVSHPRYSCHKTYEVKVKGHPEATAVDRLRRGIVIEGKRTAPADIRPSHSHRGPRASADNSWWTVILVEGRTRQIREMFHRIGHPVARLRRVAIGALTDPYLLRGAWRELTAEEVEQLRNPKPVKRAKRGTRRPRATKSAARGPREKSSGRSATSRPTARKPAARRRDSSSGGRTTDGRSGSGRFGSGRSGSGRPSSGRPSSGRSGSGRSGSGRSGRPGRSGGGRSGPKRGRRRD